MNIPTGTQLALSYASHNFQTKLCMTFEYIEQMSSYVIDVNSLHHDGSVSRRKQLDFLDVGIQTNLHSSTPF